MAVVTVAFEDLNTWLQSQPDNTVDTPYELNIINLSGGGTGLGRVLQDHPTKYVDLSPMEYSSNGFAIWFENCRNLVVSPVLENCIMTPFIAEGMFGGFTFRGCSNLKKVIFGANNDYSQMLDDIEGYTFDPPYDNFGIGGTNVILQSDRPYELKQVIDAMRTVSSSYAPTTPVYNLLSTPAKIPISLLSKELSALSANTTSTPYAINVTGLSARYMGNLRNALIAPSHQSKYVDLRATQLPSLTSLNEDFKDCETLIYAPDIPRTVTSLNSTFKNCTNLKEAPVLSERLTSLQETFYNCNSLMQIPNIPNGVTSLNACFAYCTSLTSIPTLHDNITILYRTFDGCTSVTSVENIPPNVTIMNKTFKDCSSLTSIPNVPSSVSDMTGTFTGCSSLEEITLFEADLETLVTNNKAQDCFSGCTSLTKIGVPSEPPAESDWHCFRLTFDSNSVQGKVYDKTGTAVTIPQTSVTKATLKLPIKTDELWFPNALAPLANIDAIIEKVIQYRYTYWKKTVLDPANKNFVIWADDPANTKTNIPCDVSNAINVLSEAHGGTGKTSLSNVVVGTSQSTMINTSQTDANDCLPDEKREEIYELASNALNIPVASKGILICEATKNTSSSSLPNTVYIQTFLTGSNTYRRYGQHWLTAVTWNAWKQLLTNDDVIDSVTSGNTQPVTSNAVSDAITGNTPYNPFFNNYDSTFNIDTVGAGHKTYVSTAVGGGTTGTCPSDYGVVETIVGNNGEWKFQVAKGTYGDKTYTRQNINNGGWTAWQIVIENTDVVNSAISGNMQPITSNAVALALWNAKILYIKDTRNDNFSPSYYLTSYPYRITAEFKFQDVVDNPFSTHQGFCTLITITPWGDVSGGYPTQIAIDTNFGYGLKRRMANANMEWGAWVSL